MYSQNISKGINIDIARKDYSLESLKKIVRIIHENSGNYIQLHFSDDENYAIESNFFRNNDESNNYLTKEEVRELINYSNQLNVMVIPNIELPSHSKAWLNSLKREDYDLYEDIISDYSNNTVDFLNNKKALEICEKQIDEILELFKQPQFNGEQKIVLGGDEVPGGVSHQNEFIDFMNCLGDYVKEKDYEPQIWNDSITKNGLKSLSNSFSILYWQQKDHGNSKISPTVKEFSDLDFNIYNYNADSLYFLPSPKFDENDIEKQAHYISENYSYNKFYYTNDFHKMVNSRNIKGSALSFWGENTSNMKENEILNQEIPLIKEYLQTN